MGDRAEGLRQLQEQLLQLKGQVTKLQLQKSAVGPGLPFPITAAADVPAPHDAQRFDVAGFRLSVRLGSGVLGQQQQQQQQQQGGSLEEAVEVEVVSSELPKALRQAAAAELKRLWAASGPAPGALHLPLLWEEASRQFVRLVTLLPEWLEAYQTEDAFGSTVRRWAVLSDQATVTVDTSVRPAGAGGAAGAAGAAGAVTVAVAAAHADAAPLPRALQQELAFLQRRYALRQLPANEGSTLAAQLAALQLGPGAAAADPGVEASAGPAGAQQAAVPPAVTFELDMQPTDPAWTASTHPPALLLLGWATGSYPKPGSLELRVRPTQPQLGQLPQEVLDRLLSAEVAAALSGPRASSALSATVRHVANHAAALWEQAEDMAAEVAQRRRQQQQAQQVGGQAGRQAVPPSPRAQRAAQHAPGSREPLSSGASSASDSDLDDDGAHALVHGGYASGDASSSDGFSGSTSGSGTGSEGGPEGGPGEVAGGGGGHSDAVLALQLQLEGLQLGDCDCLEVLRLNLQVACARCRTSGDLSFATAAVALPSDTPAGGAAGSSRARGVGAGSSGGASARRGVLTVTAECPTCHTAWHVELAPKLAHGNSNVLAHLRADGCAPRDLLPSMLAGQCGQCASTAAFRAATVGRWNERTCGSCHTPMRFQFATALFVPNQRSSRHGAGGDGTAASSTQHGRQGGSTAGAAAGADAFNGLLQLGQPLPDRGTCSHYRHSYRWLRFPCCGKRFPCDLCHEELTDGHFMKWATRMVCGYCSLEQAVAGRCRSCGKKLAATAAAPTGRHTRFWEGGRGQRDPNKLHPNDSRRYRGRKKTKSAKHKRVGQKGKEKERRDGA